MARWLTLEAAAQAVSVRVQQLEECLTDKAPEARFQAHGLLFDRKRWQAGKEFLQLLEQLASSSVSAATSQTLQLSSEKGRSYRWHETPIRLQIVWLPLNSDAKERQVLIAASSYNDFPISNLVGESELGELPAALAQLLGELKADLPLRKIRYQRQQSKAKSTNSARASARSTPPSVETKQQISSETTQISLF
ncbi:MULTISPECIES: hypothetical protein [Cyanophyceae]|uniref:hypothetical protein n=1 Tax=Cyanophyceae TaxID=3028117 RepID=UPI0002A66D99|nr:MULTISPECIES: hypothetical protein [Cyanophyceae]AFZ33563.1 hypothetical protein Glo7428_5182 [Gloeocapsa sp. PCC 7428]PPS42067.1 hypothetical protein B1A85_16535 [Chroococcidiopsis sp. TS-821]